MSKTMLTAAEQKAEKVKAAENRLEEARATYKAHLSDCPGSYHWAYGCKSREAARRVWLLKKERLEGILSALQCELSVAKSLWIIGWDAVKLEKPAYYDARRSPKLKGNAA